MKKAVLLLVVSMMISTSAYAQTISQQWIKGYGSNEEDVIFSVHQTMDGGYIGTGLTRSFAPGAVIDLWVLKFDANGNVAWQRTYHHGSIINSANSIQQTTDGGYIIGGFVQSADFGNSWILKINNNGDVVWQKAYGVMTEVKSIQQTIDGGYIATGTSNGGRDISIHKLDEDGSLAWNKLYIVSENSNEPHSIQQTSDGGYIVTGYARISSRSDEDIFILKLDGGGSLMWQKAYGVDGSEYGFSIQQILDGGYILAGRTNSFGAGGFDAWIIELDETGNINWQKTYGGSSSDFAGFIQQTPEGGYIMIGSTSSFGHGDSDVWFLKLDSTGGIIWQKTYGGSKVDNGGYAGNTLDGGYVLAGNSSSFGVDGFMILKLNSNGEIPGCDIIGTSNAIISDTTVEGYEISACDVFEPVAVTDTNAIPQDSSVEPSVICQYYDPNDIDGDGVTNNSGGATASSRYSSSFLADEDNCPNIPNGPFLGTCTVGNIGDSCIVNEACGVGGVCSMNQEDSDGDGIGDVCESSTEQIPTLSEWGILIFLTLILGISVVMLYRKREI
jgi:hypothetical protein